MKKEELVLRRRLNGMISRCYDPEAKGYKNYGGSGVTVCKEWLYSPQAFIDWSLANGFEEELVIDKDILCDELEISPKVYSPSTCKWITASENSKYANDCREYQKVEQYTLEGIYVNTYSSCAVAGKALGITSSNIIRVCNNERHLAGGFQWKYENTNKVITIYNPNGYRYSRKVAQVCPKTGEVLETFKSIVEATKSLGKNSTSVISSVCNGTVLPSGNTRKSAYGYVWKYV